MQGAFVWTRDGVWPEKVRCGAPVPMLVSELTRREIRKEKTIAICLVNILPVIGRKGVKKFHLTYPRARLIYIRVSTDAFRCHLRPVRHPINISQGLAAMNMLFCCSFSFQTSLPSDRRLNTSCIRLLNGQRDMFEGTSVHYFPLDTEISRHMSAVTCDSRLTGTEDGCACEHLAFATFQEMATGSVTLSSVRFYHTLLLLRLRTAVFFHV